MVSWKDRSKCRKAPFKGACAQGALRLAQARGWRSVRRALVLTSAIAVLSSFLSVNAFRSRGGFVVHRDITRSAIESEFVDQDALERMLQANDNVDREPKLSDNALHFDNEDFQHSTQRLAENLNAGIQSLGTCDRASALNSFGEALHSLQDFYSHSNWVENHLTPEGTPQTEIPICPQLVSLDGNGVFVAGPLTKDSNFVDTSWDPLSGTCTQAPGPPASVVTGGYYQVARPPGKCMHDEMNKDWWVPSVFYPSLRGSFVVNGRALHFLATDVAMRHTRAIWGTDTPPPPLISQGIKQEHVP